MAEELAVVLPRRRQPDQDEGTKVGARSNGTSPGKGYVDLAIPVQYQTNTATFEAGYTTRTMTFTASYLASNFSNANET